MVTVNDLWIDTRSLLDSYSTDGVVISDADVEDMRLKFIRFTNKALKELYKISKFSKTVEFSNKPVPNLISNGFELVDYIGTPQYYPNENGITGAKAYYFESDGDNIGSGMVEIQENQGYWTTIATIPFVSGTTSLKEFKGTIGSVFPVRMKFSGTNHYRHTNRALFSFPFSLDKIPQSRPWIKKTMPLDFVVLTAVVEEFPVRQYGNSATYKMEGIRDFYFNTYFEGNMRIVYKPVPATVTLLTDTVECDDITAQAISYYAAARLAPFINADITNFLEEKYNELKRELEVFNPESEQSIIDVLGVYNYG